MKKWISILITLSLLLGNWADTAAAKDKDKTKKTPPGLEKKDGVPPGLQKKGGVPPGQAKKQRRSAPDDAEDEKEIAGEKKIPSDIGSAPAPAKAPGGIVEGQQPAQGKSESAPPPTSSRRQPAESVPTVKTAPPEGKVNQTVLRMRERLHENLDGISGLAKDQEVREVVLRRIAAYHRFPKESLEAQLAAHPELGVGDVYAANVIARKGRKPVEDIIAEHQEGRSWGRLINEYKVDLPKMVELSLGFKSGAQNTARRLNRNS